MMTDIEQAPLVYIYNLLEDIIGTFRALKGKQKQQLEKQSTTYYNECQIFSILSEFPNRSHYCFVFLCDIDEQYVEYVLKVLGMKNKKVEILVPRINHEDNLNRGSISSILLADQNVRNRLNSFKSFDLLAFSVTNQFLKLYEYFKDKANCLQLPKLDKWQQIQRYGTKPGIRQLLQTLNNPRIFLPLGKIIYNSPQSYKNMLSDISKQLKTEGVVIKTEKGCSGYGVVILKQQQVQQLTQNGIANYIQNKLVQPFWKQLDIVMEELVDIDFSTGTPCVEIKVNGDGNVQVVWLFTMCTAHQCELDGIQCGDKMLKEEHVGRIVEIAGILGKVFYQQGYIGHLNIDCHIDKKGVVYLCECNVRRSGALYLHNLAKHLHGKQYIKHRFIKTHYLYSQKIKNIKIKELVQIIQKQGIDYNKQKGWGIVITTRQSWKDEFIQFVTITNNRQQGVTIANKFKTIFL